MQSMILSDYSITLNGVVLLAENDWLFGEEADMLRITPEFAGLEAVTLVGGGARMFERAGRSNRFHTLEWTRIRQHTDVTEAKAWQVKHHADLPVGGYDAEITFAGWNGSAILNKAAIVSANSFTLHRFSIFRYTLKGGALTHTLSLTTNILDETGDTVLDETGTTVQENP